KAKQGMLNIISKVADSLAHRTAQEMELCDKRQKFFATLPSGSTVTRATLVFAGLTLLTFVSQIAAVKFSGGQMDFGYYVAIMTAQEVVAGIGAGLTTWERGTNSFKDVAASAVTKSPAETAKAS